MIGHAMELNAKGCVHGALGWAHEGLKRCNKATYTSGTMHISSGGE